MAKEVRVGDFIIDVLREVTHLLESRRIPYAVMGGIALQAWGRERTTKDIDVSISLSEAKAEDFLRDLKSLGFRVRRRAEAIGQFKLVETEYTPPRLGIPIGLDLFISEVEYQRQVLNRARSVDVLGKTIKLISPEDLILNKVLSSRPLDLGDVRSILTEQKGLLDEQYLTHWARILGVSRRLEGIRKDTA